MTNGEEKQIQRLGESLERKFNAQIVKLHAEIAEQRREDMKQIMTILQPIAETYRTASTLGKWTTSAIVFLSVLFGLLQTIKAVFHR